MKKLRRSYVFTERFNIIKISSVGAACW